MKQISKKPYTSPELKVWGNVAELTLNNGKGKGYGNGGPSAFGGKLKNPNSSLNSGGGNGPELDENGVDQDPGRSGNNKGGGNRGGG